MKLSLEVPVIEVMVSLPLDVRIRPELKLCKPGSLKKDILLLWRKSKKSLSKLAELSLAKATDKEALPIPLDLAVEILLSWLVVKALKFEAVLTNTTSSILLELTTVSKLVSSRPSTDTTNFVLINNI